MHGSVQGSVMNWEWRDCSVCGYVEIVQYGVWGSCTMYKMSWHSHTLWGRKINFKCEGYGNLVEKNIRAFEDFSCNRIDLSFTEKNL